MVEVEKTVFISYRRATSSRHLASSIYDKLQERQYDVYLDVERPDQGRFDTTILKEITVREHFVILLAAGTLDRCYTPDGRENRQDWLRIEIEHALNRRRHIIPVLDEDFAFPTGEKSLRGQLGLLAHYDGIPYKHDYREASFNQLFDFLEKPFQDTEPLPELTVDFGIAHDLVTKLINEANNRIQPQIAPFINRSAAQARLGLLKAGLRQATIEELTEVLRLDPTLTSAYIERGVLYEKKQQYNPAIEDYTQAISVEPENAVAYHNRGNIRERIGDSKGAIDDYTRSIELHNPQLYMPYDGRGRVYKNLGHYDEAIRDLKQAIAFNKDFANAYAGLGDCYYKLGKYKEAIHYYDWCLKLPLTNESRRLINEDIIRNRLYELKHKS